MLYALLTIAFIYQQTRDNCLARANKYLSASPEQKSAMEKERRKQFGLED
jgi:hypothetical protein